MNVAFGQWRAIWSGLRSFKCAPVVQFIFDPPTRQCFSQQYLRGYKARCVYQNHLYSSNVYTRHILYVEIKTIYSYKIVSTWHRQLMYTRRLCKMRLTLDGHLLWNKPDSILHAVFAPVTTQRQLKYARQSLLRSLKMYTCHGAFMLHWIMLHCYTTALMIALPSWRYVYLSLSFDNIYMNHYFSWFITHMHLGKFQCVLNIFRPSEASNWVADGSCNSFWGFREQYRWVCECIKTIPLQLNLHKMYLRISFKVMLFILVSTGNRISLIWLGHETMVYAACLSILIWNQWLLRWYGVTLASVTLDNSWHQAYESP